MSSFRTSSAFLAFLILLSSVASGDDAAGDKSRAETQSNNIVQDHVTSSGGASATSTGYRSHGTLGQPTPIGIGTTSSATLYAGYWGQARFRTPTGITTPTAFKNELFQNYPNPFNPSTTVAFTVAHTNPVDIKIFNVRGQIVKTLLNEEKSPGKHRVTWDGKNDAGTRVASGVYFYRLRIGSYVSVKKLVLLK